MDVDASVVERMKPEAIQNAIDDLDKHKWKSGSWAESFVGSIVDQAKRKGAGNLSIRQKVKIIELWTEHCEDSEDAEEDETETMDTYDQFKRNS